MNDMSEKTKEILEKLEQYKSKYPQLINLWEKTLLKYEDNLHKIQNECENMLNNIPYVNHDLQDICQALCILSTINNYYE
tara:strand:+ start:1204 stop:1443 length:240 start_codon:yes stop_codon:yes gene_type:complete